MKNAEQFEMVLNNDRKVVKVDPREGYTSASNAEADDLCQGRHQAQKGLAELPDPEGESDHGNAIHAALATRDPSKLSEDQHQTYDRCVEVEKWVVEQFFGEEASDLMTAAEERFWVVIDPKTNRPIKHSGQADRAYRSKSKALVIDYKTLPGSKPAASSNKQLRDLVVLVSRNLMCASVGCVVIQPLVTMKPEVCVYNGDQIKTAEQLMFDRVRGSHTPNSRRVAGVVQCAFCRAKFKCVEYERFHASMVPVMTDFINLPVADWTPEQCVVFLERRLAAEKWLTDAKEAIRMRVANGELPGWQIGEGDHIFEITDMNELHKRAVLMGIEAEAFINLCDIGKTNLSKLVRKATDTKGKALNAKVDELVSGIIGDRRKRGSVERVTP